MIGEIVDGHEILRPLGAGGMGEVYLARGAQGALRAFKVVRTDRQTSPQAAARFRREVLALGKLQHPNIIRIVDAGRLDSGALYLGMEYVPGPDLQAAVGWDGPFPVGDALRVIVQLAAALAYAHGAGVIHRDLKPANVILEEGDVTRAKIIDFGLAKIAESEGLTRLTEDKQALGSPLYWAPEQSNAVSVGPAADVYSLAGILYFLLSGEPMFKPRPAVAMVYAHSHELPEPLAQRCRGIELPEGLEELVARCAAKIPMQRPTADEIVIELDRMLATLPSTVGKRRAAQRLFTGTGISNMGAALTAQIRQVLVDLAAVLERPIDDIERIQQELSELELDLAMLESDVEAAIDPEVEERRDGAAARVAQLQSALADAYRELFDAVNADRNRPVPDAHALFGELDSLVEQYRTL
ncbi:MAG TPA: serine/threonine-protein kinase [Kofleriaceae bacterium]|nr:serine/threonine-protein kinase [Kofleriaceae bacterium]